MMQVADAHKSIATYRTRVTGHEAHSSKPWLGVSAVHVACELVGALERIGRGTANRTATRTGVSSRPFRPSMSDMIHGGTARNIMARTMRVVLGVPRPAGYAAATARSNKFETFCAALATERFGHFPDARIETFVETEAPGLSAGVAIAPPPLWRWLWPRPITPSPCLTPPKPGNSSAVGLPAVICGPGSIDQAHQPDEYIEIAQLLEGVAFLRRLAGKISA